MKRWYLKYIEEYFFRTVMFISTCIIILILCQIVFSIVKKGLPSLSLELITETPKGGFYLGKEGGILNAILGSFYLASGATVLALIIGLPMALYINVHLIKRKKLVNSVRFLLDVLWGVPSVVYGAFGFMFMIIIGAKTSLFAGISVVTLFILPIIIRSMDEGLKVVPRGLLEASYSIGATKAEIAYIVYVRQAYPVIVTAVLLAFGRAIGDAAAVMFTAGFTDNIPVSLSQPAATLPLAIFYQLTSPIEEVKNRAYAAAVILTLIILLLSIVSRIVSKKYIKNAIKY